MALESLLGTFWKASGIIFHVFAYTLTSLCLGAAPSAWSATLLICPPVLSIPLCQTHTVFSSSALPISQLWSQFFWMDACLLLCLSKTSVMFTLRSCSCFSNTGSRWRWAPEILGSRSWRFCLGKIRHWPPSFPPRWGTWLLDSKFNYQPRVQSLSTLPYLGDWVICTDFPTEQSCKGATRDAGSQIRQDSALPEHYHCQLLTSPWGLWGQRGNSRGGMPCPVLPGKESTCFQWNWLLDCISWWLNLALFSLCRDGGGEGSLPGISSLPTCRLSWWSWVLLFYGVHLPQMFVGTWLDVGLCVQNSP